MLLQYPCNWGFCCHAESNHHVWEIWFLKPKLITLISRSYFLCSMSLSKRFKWTYSWSSVEFAITIHNIDKIKNVTRQHGNKMLNRSDPTGTKIIYLFSAFPKSRSQCMVIGKGVQVGIRCINSACKNLNMGCQKWNFVSVRLERHRRIEILAFHIIIVTW